MPIRQGFAPGTAAATRSAMGLFAPVNKKGYDGESGDSPVEGDFQDELSLELTDEELLSLSNTWEADFKAYEGDIKTKQDRNVDFWLGKHPGYDNSMYKTVDNVVFESLETFLPIVTRQTPTPVVLADNTPEGIELAATVQKMLQYVGDTDKMKTKLKSVLRNWSLYYVGVMKMGYDFMEEEISLTVVRPTEMILDPTGMNRFCGERKKATASRLCELFPKKAARIKELVQEKMGTSMTYYEFWTDDYVFWRLGGEILLKHKNPHWNYTTTENITDEYGVEMEKEVPGINHFKQPKKPYLFLNVFSLGKQPHDETSVVEQTLSLQESVNKRTRQIDRNADDMNNGWIVSSLFTKDQAKNLADSIRRGGVAQAPTPQINNSIQRIQAAPLPQFIPNDLNDKRSEIMNIMGVRGSTAQGVMSERTVRGKIEIKGQDVDRVSLITEFVEQFSDDIFNWMVQLMHVYYTQEHVAAVVGENKAVDYVRISSQNLNRRLDVSVKEGSLIPQDPLTRRNEAIDLWNAGALDPITLFERLDDPNPRETAMRLLQWKQNPGSLFGQPQASQPPPGAPVEGQSQEQQMSGMAPPQSAQPVPFNIGA